MTITKIPTLIPCASTALKAHAYDPATQTLFLQFPSGNVYAYPEVSVDLYDGLCKAESMGKFYGANIKGKFTANPVPVAQADADTTEGAEAD